MNNKELPPTLRDKISAIEQFIGEANDAGKDNYYYSIELDPLTGEPRKTVMLATESKDLLKRK